MTFRSIYFDCDSTLSAIEGIDELGRFASEDVQKELVKLTKLAMDGKLPLEEAYPKRLELLQPSEAQVGSLSESYIGALVPEVSEVIVALTHLGKQIGIVSAGVMQGVLPLARHLGIPEENVHAVTLQFDADGKYQDFDRSCPLWKNGGKRNLLAAIPEQHKPACLVGDGVTDLEAAEVVDLFVGFGGVERREAVEAASEQYLTGPGLGPLLELVLDEDEKAQLRELPPFAPLLSPAND
ncbi:MAG: HAD-IB family phosphatase [Planctomycetota bacterium]